jgi:hypothetical protein
MAPEQAGALAEGGVLLPVHAHALARALLGGAVAGAVQVRGLLAVPAVKEACTQRGCNRQHGNQGQGEWRGRGLGVGIPIERA